MTIECLYYLGKGLKENTPPNREDYIFGADFNDFSTEGWTTFLPIIWDEASVYDLSLITINSEVLLAFMTLTGLTEATVVTVTFKWYRDDRPEFILYEYEFEDTFDSQMWCYSYIGWAWHEIVKNGAYHVDIDVKLDGTPDDSETLNFTVSGIVAAGDPGHIWTYSTGIYYLDDGGLRRAATFTDTTENGTAGYLWVEGNYLHYIDGNGDERRYEGEDCGVASGAGHIWIDFGYIYYIDSNSHRRRIACLAV